MKKKYKIITIFIILIILVGTFMIRVNEIKGQYPQITKQEYATGEQFIWQDFQIKVTNFQILNADEVKAQWENCDTSYIQNCDLLIAELEVTYTGSEESSKFPIVKIKGQSGSWYNSSELNCILEFNEGNAICNKNETRTLYTAIGLSYDQLSDRERKKIEQNGIQLVFQTYPEVVYVKLESMRNSYEE